MATSNFTLNTGATIPAIGLGTWQSAAGEVETAVYHAITVAGVRHIDCAFAYGNEAEVGRAFTRVFSEGKVSRSEVFVTTKLWGTWHTRTTEALEASLKNLGLDYVDLYLMHWPIPLNPSGNHPFFPTKPDGTREVLEDWSFVDTWKAMEKLVDSGKTKAIGVSNCSIPYLEHLLKSATIVPAVNQVELHPLLPQEKLVAYCKEKGIRMTAYSPLGSTGGPLLKDETVKKVAEKHGISVGNVLINWLVARGIVAIPKSVTPSRIEENAKIVALDEEDVEAIWGIHNAQGVKRFVSPPWPVSLLFDDAPWAENFKTLL
ncbi:NADP-dependent oxidoreductase domain-containing protein [Tricharina praecox]|uniref:NADP-dependent oxidoreductase domain-containing protein n=1 Tax=Tricharina praecox TaxID=43433 RepID=UPI0022204915|nr:NADP-dependent oxidoreductase domain-containing protein [Tricharina praecox]KAI5842801.1 NADP-dependent oxidoreductase domain-containing protein [Tricharina praecox]